jgi:hypothetical protein
MNSIEKTNQTRAAIKAATVLIRQLDELMRDPFATPQRLAELKKWQNALVANNLAADAATIERGIQQIQGYLNSEKQAIEALKPRSQQEIIDEQARLYKKSNEHRKRLDKIVTDSGHLSKPK